MTTVEEQYWDLRYLDNKTSGNGSIGDYRKFKWSIIDKYVPFLRSVVDVGCGDLSFWGERDCEDYTGIDISKTIIEKNRILRPDWEFLWSNAEKKIEGLSKNTVFCFDMLFHVMNNDSYYRILENLCYYSREYIFIYTWINNPFQKSRLIKRLFQTFPKLKLFKTIELMKKIISKNKYSDGKYQYYRNLENELGVFKKKGFDLIETIQHTDNIGAMYIFRANSTEKNLMRSYI